MSKRRILECIFILLILGCVAVWWKSRNRLAGTKGDSTTQSNRGKTGPADSLEGNPSYQDRVKLFMEAVQFRDLPCRGKVVDEKGAPVSGATIIFGASRGYEKPTSGTTTSDHQGNFSVEGQRGNTLSMHAEHPNYVSTGESRTVIEPLSSPIGHHRRTDQVTLVLRQKLPEQNLIEQHDRLRFNCGNGSGVVYYDLKSRTLVAAESPTTLRIRTEVAPRGETRGAVDWNLTADIPAGWVLKKTDPYLFEAPAEGYEPSFKMVEEARSSDWKTVGILSLFVKLKTGEFGTVDLRFDSRDGTGRILTSSLNPEPGNRNLTPKTEP